MALATAAFGAFKVTPILAIFFFSSGEAAAHRMDSFGVDEKELRKPQLMGCRAAAGCALRHAV
jgi:hypothetical protein